MDNNQSAIVLKEPRRKRETLIKPASSGFVERTLVVASGLGIAYSFAVVAPIASIAALGALGLYFLQEVQSFQSPKRAKEIEEILNSRTVRHHSILECKHILKAQYPVDVINRAIEAMIGNCEWIFFKPTDDHPLAPFGEVFCYVDPHDGQHILPIEGIYKMMDQWGFEPTIEVHAEKLLTTKALPAGSKTLANSKPVDEEIDDNRPKTSAALLKRLKAECPEMLLLVKSPPIRLVGKQRTGKSTFAQKLALLRTILLPGHKVAWSTPHREADNPVPEALNPVGTTVDGAKDFRAIETLWVASQEMIDKGQQLNTTIVWDEFGSYDAFEDISTLGSSLRSFLRESSKHNYYPILVVHGDQSAFYPGVTGILGTLQQSTIKVETVGEIANAFGEMKPTGWVEVTQLDGSKSRFKVPDWLTVDLLLSLQSKDTRPALLDAIVTSPVEPAQKVDQSPVSNSVYKVVENVSPSSEESIHQRVSKKMATKLLAANGEWVKSKDLVNNTFSQPKDREVAKELLDIAVSKGKLDCDKITNPNNTETILYRVNTTK
ncbi:MAG: hypothetical protein KME16_23630 [Scytolyngbya sp. HA4215-MV1]|jgi:hypothetical protein|nr:hypothetical protein [Scytolyngbya sp. HA4215-MV1]